MIRGWSGGLVDAVAGAGVCGGWRCGEVHKEVGAFLADTVASFAMAGGAGSSGGWSARGRAAHSRSGGYVEGVNGEIVVVVVIVRTGTEWWGVGDCGCV